MLAGLSGQYIVRKVENDRWVTVCDMNFVDMFPRSNVAIPSQP